MALHSSFSSCPVVWKALLCSSELVVNLTNASKLLNLPADGGDCSWVQCCHPARACMLYLPVCLSSACSFCRSVATLMPGPLWLDAILTFLCHHFSVFGFGYQPHYGSWWFVRPDVKIFSLMVFRGHFLKHGFRNNLSPETQAQAACLIEQVHSAQVRASHTHLQNVFYFVFSYRSRLIT